MTTIKLSGGDLGTETMMVRADLRQASAMIEVDYGTGDGWERSQFQTADARHTVSGLIDVAKTLAARAVEMTTEEFECQSEQITATSYQVRTPNTVENTGLDSAIFASRDEAEQALAVLASARDIAASDLGRCSVVTTTEPANTSFAAWNEKGW
jgi:hypothetical protein